LYRNFQGKFPENPELLNFRKANHSTENRKMKQNRNSRKFGYTLWRLSSFLVIQKTLFHSSAEISGNSNQIFIDWKALVIRWLFLTRPFICTLITSPSVVWLMVFGQSVDLVPLTINAFLLSILLQIFKISKLCTEIVMNFQVLRNFYNNFIATNMIHHVIYIAIHERRTALILCTIK